MDKFMQSLSDQTKDTLVGIIDLGISFCLVCLTYQVMQGFNGCWAGSSVPDRIREHCKSRTNGRRPDAEAEKIDAAPAKIRFPRQQGAG